jgi:hypothetical protein
LAFRGPAASAIKREDPFDFLSGRAGKRSSNVDFLGRAGKRSQVELLERPGKRDQFDFLAGRAGKRSEQEQPQPQARFYMQAMRILRYGRSF